MYQTRREQVEGGFAEEEPAFYHEHVHVDGDNPYPSKFKSSNDKSVLQGESRGCPRGRFSGLTAPRPGVSPTQACVRG